MIESVDGSALTVECCITNTHVEIRLIHCNRTYEQNVNACIYTRAVYCSYNKLYSSDLPLLLVIYIPGMPIFQLINM